MGIDWYWVESHKAKPEWYKVRFYTTSNGAASTRVLTIDFLWSGNVCLQEFNLDVLQGLHASSGFHEYISLLKKDLNWLTSGLVTWLFRIIDFHFL